VRFSIPGLTRVAGLSRWMIRKGLRRLLAKGALRLAQKGKWGHTIEVRLPEEVRAVRARKIAARKARPQPIAANFNLEDADFLATRDLRRAIHAREDVLPRAWMGSNSYRNLISSCSECNSLKGERRAEDFLRWLYREGRLESGELKERLRALEKMAAGKMRPAVV
jgi:hypothetical protein